MTGIPHSGTRGAPRRRRGFGDAAAQDEPFNLLEVLTGLLPARAGQDNASLERLFDEDQGDRAGSRLPDDLAARDRGRRDRVLQLIGDGLVRTPADCFHAAMVLQHGRTLDHYRLAFELARRAADAGHPRARWLAAAAMDRWLMYRGLPQRFGTQYLHDGETWTLYEVDAATTDEERAAWDVPSLAEARANLEGMNRDPGELN